jgi:sodium-dependent dicarboxylate transporter 2/3/5
MSETRATASVFVRRVRLAGLVAGPLLALAAYAALPREFVGADGALVELSTSAPAVVALLVWMAVWWITEAIDVEATALLPIAVGPLIGAGSLGALAAPYASPLVFLVLGGFLLALALQRHGLDRRIALAVLARVGTRPRRIVGGFMLATAGLSAFVSNTATAAAMLPLALSVTRRVGGGEERRTFRTALLLGIAYSASIGGIATLVGTPPNGFLAQFASDELGTPIRFLDWLMLGVPLAAALLPLAWLLLTRVALKVDDTPVAGADFRAEARALGPLRAPHVAVFGVFVFAVLGWIVAPLVGLANVSDAGVAIAAGLLLFVLPVGGARLLDWRDTKELPWGVLVLFGGGLALASAVEASGLDLFVGAAARTIAELPPLVLVIVLTAAMVVLTEIMSNTASATIFVPIAAALAGEVGLAPLELAVPVTVAASLGFMLPAATPPNAIVFASGDVSVPVMARVGLLLNVAGVVVIVVGTRLLLPLLPWSGA